MSKALGVCSVEDAMQPKMMKKKAMLLFLAAVSVLALLPAGLAAERVHFKNGRSLEVISTREEGQMLILTLPNKSEIGVPKSLIEEIEGGRPELASERPSNSQIQPPRGKKMEDLIGYKKALREAEMNLGGTLRPDGMVDHSGDGKVLSLGFSYKGSHDVTRTSGQGKGIDVRTLRKGSGSRAYSDNPNVLNPQEPKAGAGAQPVEGVPAFPVREAAPPPAKLGPL